MHSAPFVSKTEFESPARREAFTPVLLKGVNLWQERSALRSKVSPLVTLTVTKGDTLRFKVVCGLVPVAYLTAPSCREKLLRRGRCDGCEPCRKKWRLLVPDLPAEHAPFPISCRWYVLRDELL